MAKQHQSAYLEEAPDDHRLELDVALVRWDDGPPSLHLRPI